MDKYEIMFEAIQEQYENGDITFEEAEMLNEESYNKYVESTALQRHTENKYNELKKKSNELQKNIQK